MDDAETQDGRGPSLRSGIDSLSDTASTVQGSMPAEATTPVPPAAVAAATNASSPFSLGKKGLSSSHFPSSSLFPSGPGCSASMMSPQTAESSITGGVENPFAFQHARSTRLLTPRGLLAHPPAFPSSFSAVAGGPNGDKQTETSRRRVSSFLCSEDKHSSGGDSSGTSFFNTRRRRNVLGDDSLRLLLPPRPGDCIPSGVTVEGQSHNTALDSSNSCTTTGSCRTTDASSHAGTVVGGSSPMLSFSMPATPRLHFHFPDSHQTAAYTGCTGISFSDAASSDGAAFTAIPLPAAGGDTTAKASPFNISTATVVSECAAATARAWPAKRRRSIQVDGSNSKNYLLPSEQLHQQVPYLSVYATGEQQQQPNICVSASHPHPDGTADVQCCSNSNTQGSSKTPTDWIFAQQQQTQEEGREYSSTVTRVNCEGYPVRPRAFSDMAGEAKDHIPRVIVRQPDEVPGRGEPQDWMEEEKESRGTISFSTEKQVKAEEDQTHANSRAMSDADITGTDNNGCSGVTQTVTSPRSVRNFSIAAPEQGESTTTRAEEGTGQQRRLEFLDSGCYSLCYHTAMAAVPYSALSTDSAAAQMLEQQQAYLLDREREARRRRKACLSVLRSVHNALIASPTRETQPTGAARRSSSPGISPAATSSLPLSVPFIDSLSSSRKSSFYEDENTLPAPGFGARAPGKDSATATAHSRAHQDGRGGTELSFAAASSSSQYSFAAPTGVTYISVPGTASGAGQQPQTAGQQQQQHQFLLSVSPLCKDNQQHQQNMTMAADQDASGNLHAVGRATASNCETYAGPSLGAPGGASDGVSRALANTNIPGAPSGKQAQEESASLNTSALLRLRPEWLSPYTLAALIGACVHCYDVIRAAYPPPEPPPRLCLISLPALYTQLPPHLLAGAVLLDESALSLGSPPQCMPIECSSISRASGHSDVANGAGRRSSSNNSNNNSEKESCLNNNGRSGDEEKQINMLPGSLLGQFDIIVCETRSVMLSTVENVAACVKALSRRRRRARFGGPGKKAARRHAEAVLQPCGGSHQSRRGCQGENFSVGRKDVHMQSTTSDNEEEEKEKEDKEDGLEGEEVDVAAAAFGCLSLLKPGQPGGATTSKRQLQEQQLQQQLQQQETFQRLPSSVRVIMLSTCLLSAVVDDLLGLKQCRFQPYVPSSALSSLQLQCIYTNFEDYPLFQKHNDFDFATRVRARRRSTRYAHKGGRRSRATEGMESGGGNLTGSGVGSRRGTGTEAGGDGDRNDTVLRDPLISRALVLQAEQEARAAAHPGEILGEVTLAHSTTNDEFSSEKSAAEEELDDATDMAVGGQQEEVEGDSCRSCQRSRETTLLTAFEGFHLQASPRIAMTMPPQHQEQPLQPAFMGPSPSQGNADGSTASAYSDPAACCQHSRRFSSGGHSQRPGKGTNNSSGTNCEISRSKAYRGITMRQGDDEEDDGIDYDLECGSNFGMVAHEL